MDKSNPDIKLFISYACTEFNDATGDKLFIDWPKDSRLVQSLLATYTLDELKTKWLLFLASDDEFIKQAGYSIGIFKVSINKLITKRKPKYRPPADAQTFDEPDGGPVDPVEVRKLINKVSGGMKDMGKNDPRSTGDVE